MAITATFSPPIKAVADADSLPRIMVALTGGGDALVVDMNGRFEMLPLSGLTVDWRYDPKSETWDDAHPNVTGELGDDE